MIVALTVTAAVFCCYLYLIERAAGIAAICVVIVSLGCASAIYIIRYKRGKIKLRVPLAFCIALVLSVSVVSFGTAVADEWNEGYRFSGYCYVTGRVSAVDMRSGQMRFNLNDVTINGEKANGLLRLGIEIGDYSAVDFVRLGDNLSFGGFVNAVKLYENGKINGTAFRTDIRYSAMVDIDSLSFSPGEAKPLESFMQNWRELYVQNMGVKYGNIAFSMLTGDKLALDYDVTSYFSAAGLGHILAVSGLHIGFMVLILNFLLKKFGRKVRYSVILAVMLAYTVIADFSPSVIRAVIMTVISGIGIMIGGRRDLMSSLLCSYSLILAVKPYYMFEAGFLFSFASIFGIALFANSFMLGLTKHGVNRKIAGSVCASTAVTLSTFPTGSYIVGYICPIALISNAVLIPYLTAVFISIVCLSPIAAIPGCGVMLVVPKYLLIALDYIAIGLSNIPYSTIALRTSGAVFLCYPLMFFASEFVMYPKKCKIAARSYSAAMCILLFAVCAL